MAHFTKWGGGRNQTGPLLLAQRAAHIAATGLSWCLDESWVFLTQESQGQVSKQ